MKTYLSQHGIKNEILEKSGCSVMISLNLQYPNLSEKMQVLGINNDYVKIHLTVDVNECINDILPLVYFISSFEISKNEPLESLTLTKIPNTKKGTALQYLAMSISRKLTFYDNHFNTLSPEKKQIVLFHESLLFQYLTVIKETLDDLEANGGYTKNTRMIDNSNYKSIRLFEVRTEHWEEFLKLELHNWQTGYVENPRSLLDGSVFESDNKSYQLYAIEYQRKIVGSVTLKLDGAKLWLGGFHIDKSYQSLGIGSHTFNQIAQYVIRHKNIDCMQLDVEVSNERAVYFYLSRRMNITASHTENGKNYWVLEAKKSDLISYLECLGVRNIA